MLRHSNSNSDSMHVHGRNSYMPPSSPSKSRYLGGAGQQGSWRFNKKILGLGLVLMLQAIAFLCLGGMFSEDSTPVHVTEEGMQDAAGHVISKNQAFDEQLRYRLNNRALHEAAVNHADYTDAEWEEHDKAAERKKELQLHAFTAAQNSAGNSDGACRKKFMKECSWLQGTHCTDCVWTHAAWFQAHNGCPSREEVASWCALHKTPPRIRNHYTGGTHYAMGPVSRARDGDIGQAMVRDLESEMMQALAEDINQDGAQDRAAESVHPHGRTLEEIRAEVHRKRPEHGKRRKGVPTPEPEMAKKEMEVANKHQSHVVDAMNSGNVVATFAAKRVEHEKLKIAKEKVSSHESTHSVAQCMIPKPKLLVEDPGVTFKLNHKVHVRFAMEDEHPGLVRVAKQIAQAHGSALVIANPNSALEECEGCITLGLFPEGEQGGDERCAELGEQGYHLEVKHNAISVLACQEPGLFYGAQTLLFHFIRGSPKNLNGKATIISAVKIADSPRFPWRGFLLDTARHYYSPTRIKALLDVLALYKINRFHWHLTDNEAWRLEIKQYKDLTSGSQGEFYTQDVVMDIITYAKHRFIEIVPEIDMPGHCHAALNAYPELLNCHNQDYHMKDVLCLGGNPAIYKVAETVLTEVAGLFPFPVIHVGGDEADYSQLVKCKECMSTLKGGEKPGQLHVNFMKHILELLKGLDRKAVVWDEFVDHVVGGDLDVNLMAQVWRQQATAEVAVQAANLDVILSPKDYSYLDYKDTDITFGRMWDWEPAPTWMAPSTISRILGGEACIWSEKIEGKTLDAWVWPRMLPLAERLWSPRAAHTDAEFQDFLARVEGQHSLQDLLGVESDVSSKIKTARSSLKNSAPVELKTPGAKVWSSLMTFGGNFPELAFDDKQSSFFWTQENPMVDDHVTVELPQAMMLSGVKILTGHQEHRGKIGDMPGNTATISIAKQLPSSDITEDDSKGSFIDLETTVTNTKTGQFLEAQITGNGEGIRIIRLRFTKPMATWVAVRDIRIW
jgi:hexosaminidase